MHVEVEPGFEVVISGPAERHIRLSRARAIRQFVSENPFGFLWAILRFGGKSVVGDSFVFNKKTGSITHNTKHVTTFFDLEQIQIRAGADIRGREILTETPDEQYYTHWKFNDESRQPAHLLLIYGGGRSVRLGHSTAVRQLRRAADIIAEFTDVEVWDNGPEENVFEDLLCRDLGTGKHDPDVHRRIGSFEDAFSNKLIIVLLVITVILMLF